MTHYSVVDNNIAAGKPSDSSKSGLL